MTGRAAPIEDPYFVALNEAEDDPHERDLIRELRLLLLDALEAPGLSADELRGRADSGDIVTEEVLGLTLDQANLRDEWLPRLRAALLCDATDRSPAAT